MRKKREQLRFSVKSEKKIGMGEAAHFRRREGRKEGRKRGESRGRSMRAIRSPAAAAVIE